MLEKEIAQWKMMKQTWQRSVELQNFHWQGPHGMSILDPNGPPGPGLCEVCQPHNPASDRALELCAPDTWPQDPVGKGSWVRQGRGLRACPAQSP